MTDAEQQKIQERTAQEPIELKSGYWNPYDKAQEMNFTGGVQFTSTGVYGTPIFFNQETKKYVQVSFHLTSTGEVYMIENISETAVIEPNKQYSLPERKIRLVGTNGKVFITPQPESRQSSYSRPPDTFSFTPFSPEDLPKQLFPGR